MPIEISGQVGPQVLSDGATQPFRQGKSGEMVMQELHGRFYEQNYRQNLYTAAFNGSISNVTFTTGTLGATCTPVLGVWNPLSNTVNLVILQAVLSVIITALQNTGGAPFLWCTSTGNGAISTGGSPRSRKTLLASGSAAKDMSGIALTGLTNNLAVASTSSLGGGNVFNIATLDTAAGFSTLNAPTVENVDGAWIVPPGGVLALLAGTTPVAHNAASGLLWEEVPL